MKAEQMLSPSAHIVTSHLHWMPKMIPRPGSYVNYQNVLNCKLFLYTHYSRKRQLTYIFT